MENKIQLTGKLFSNRNGVLTKGFDISGHDIWIVYESAYGYPRIFYSYQKALNYLREEF